MTIPQNLFITDLTSLNGSTLAKKMQTFLNEMIAQEYFPQMYISLYLLEHMLGSNSSKIDKHFFQPYFDILPKSLEAFSSIPVTWSKEDLALLKETSMVYNDAVFFNENCKNNYELFSSVSGYVYLECISFHFTQLLCLENSWICHLLFIWSIPMGSPGSTITHI